MTKPIPTLEPDTIVAGDYAQWKRSLADYPAGTWVLSYALIMTGESPITVTAGASGTDHLVTLAAATTAAWAPGVWKWQAYVTSGAQRYTIGNGEITVASNYADGTVTETRTHAKITLDAIEAVIEKRATLDQQEYTIGTRSLKRTPMADLIRLRDKYAAMVKSEENADRIRNGGPSKNRIYVRI